MTTNETAEDAEPLGDDESLDFVDFDAAWAERETKPKRVKVLGKVYDLPAHLPASVVLRLNRMARAGQKELNDSDALDLAEKLLPPDALEAWLDGGIDLEQLGDLIQHALKVYGFRVGEEGGDVGEATAPATGATPTGSAG